MARVARAKMAGKVIKVYSLTSFPGLENEKTLGKSSPFALALPKKTEKNLKRPKINQKKKKLIIVIIIFHQG